MRSQTELFSDNDKLHRSHDIWWIWRHIDCGCIMNDLGFRIRYCQRDNLRKGTHWHSAA